jgi:hypothetical protein
MKEEASLVEACLAGRLEGGLSFARDVTANEALGPLWKALLLPLKVLDLKTGPRGRGLILELIGPPGTEFSIRVSENTVVALIEALNRTFTKASHRKQYQTLWAKRLWFPLRPLGELEGAWHYQATLVRQSHERP